MGIFGFSLPSDTLEKGKPSMIIKVNPGSPPLVSSREPDKSAAGWLGLNDVEYNYSYLGD